MKEQQYLRELIKNISNTDIVLEEVTSQVDLGNISLENIAQWQPNVSLDISTLDELDTKSNTMIINVIYTLSERITTNTTTANNDNHYICNSKIRYRLLFIVNVTDSLKNALQNVETRNKLVKNLARTTGVLMVFPYLRHMPDILHKEMRLPIPPLPPFLIEKVTDK